MSAQPFQISVPDSALKLLKAKLELATFPDETDSSQAYGVNLSDIKRLAKYWQDGFDWRKQEARLNAQLPQFTTKVSVDGFGELNVHFVHQKSSKEGAIPLLFCHGWPGSFLEVIKIIKELAEPESGTGPHFHVVAPSLPNFGFSDGVKKAGFSIPQYAETMHKIMLQLGYDQYVTQGGDWGYLITRIMGVQYPKHCIASHVNFVSTQAPSKLQHPLQSVQDAVQPYTDEEKAGLERSKWFSEQGFGYNLEQSTKPATLAFSLQDSPVGLLAWIFEKLQDWTDSYPWTDDEVLTWVSIYQFSTAGPGQSTYIYYESEHSQQQQTSKAHEFVPHVALGISIFPQDVRVPPRSWLQALGNITFEKRHSSGGHFAAYEKPELLVADLRDMFAKGMSCGRRAGHVKRNSLGVSG